MICDHCGAAEETCPCYLGIRRYDLKRLNTQVADLTAKLARVSATDTVMFKAMQEDDEERATLRSRLAAAERERDEAKLTIEASENLRRETNERMDRALATTNNLRAQVARLQADGDRYDYLRDLIDTTHDGETGESFVRFDPLLNLNCWVAAKDEAAVDLAIDAARAGTGGT